MDQVMCAQNGYAQRSKMTWQRPHLMNIEKIGCGSTRSTQEVQFVFILFLSL
jgi:hypothetical protein